MAPTPAKTRRNPKWPQDWERDWELCEAFTSAMLRPQSVPVEFASFKIMRDMVEDEIEECSSSWIKLSLNFGHEEPILSGSKPLENCLACGNCLAGCPYNGFRPPFSYFLIQILAKQIWPSMDLLRESNSLLRIWRYEMGHLGLIKNLKSVARKHIAA